MQVFATGYIPFVGNVFNFLLLSWMYAYYCFEYVLVPLLVVNYLLFAFSLVLIISDDYLSRYKWNLSGVSLDRRLDFFESNWAFFAGFGTVTLLHSFFDKE